MVLAALGVAAVYGCGPDTGGGSYDIKLEPVKLKKRTYGIARMDMAVYADPETNESEEQ